MTQDRLKALVLQAMELRETPYLRDAVTAIVDEYEREPLARLERRQERIGRLVRLWRGLIPGLQMLPNGAAGVSIVFQTQHNKFSNR